MASWARLQVGRETEIGKRTSEPALLVVWNPELELATVWKHVEKLDERGYVWWAKLRSLDSRESESSKRRLAQFAHEVRSAGRDFVLYVTDFQMLHALRVTEMRLGTAATLSADEPLPEYARDRRAVSALFKVTDIRELSDERIATLEFLRQRLEFSPYSSSTKEYPMQVPGLGVDATFIGDRPESTLSNFVPWYMEQALKTAERSFGPPLWKNLDDDTKAFFASAVVTRARMKKSGGSDHSAMVVSFGKAMEAEWRRVSDVFQQAGLYQSKTFLDCFQNKRTKEVGLKVTNPNSLGFIGNVLATVRNAKKARAPVSVPESLQRLAWNREWAAWMPGFAAWRNVAAHAKEIPEEAAEQIWQAFSRPKTLFAPLVSVHNPEVRPGKLEATSLPWAPALKNWNEAEL